MRNSTLALLALALTTGCDDPVVADNIDVFTGAYLPNWMADCTSSEVQTKAQSLLQYGLVEARMSCEVTVQVPPEHGSPTGNPLKSVSLSSSLLADGSCLQNGSLYGRSENRCDTPIVIADNFLGTYPPGFPDDPELDVTKYWLDGDQVVAEACDSWVYVGITPNPPYYNGGYPWGSDYPERGCVLLDVQQDFPCTGFNLERFEIE